MTKVGVLCLGVLAGCAAGGVGVKLDSPLAPGAAETSDVRAVIGSPCVCRSSSRNLLVTYSSEGELVSTSCELPTAAGPRGAVRCQNGIVECAVTAGYDSCLTLDMNAVRATN
jgi:hypothetical protein